MAQSEEKSSGGMKNNHRNSFPFRDMASPRNGLSMENLQSISFQGLHEIRVPIENTKQRKVSMVAAMKGAGRNHEDLEIELKNKWVEKNFEVKDCTCIVVEKEDSQRCGCGRDLYKHTKVKSYTDKEVGLWKKDFHVRKQPFCHFGAIDFLLKDEFPRFGENQAKYVRLSDDTEPNKVSELIENTWEIKLPDLVISFIGGHSQAVISPETASLLKRGLSQVLQVADVWMFTGGSEVGISRVVGKTFCEEERKHRRSHNACFGFIPWGCVADNDVLEHKAKEVIYEVPKPNVEPNQTVLDRNHTHFFLVDDGTAGQFGGELEFKAKLEKHYCSEGNAGIPSVILFVEGGLTAINTMYLALSVHPKIAVVVLEGSGRAADAIAVAKTEYEYKWKSKMTFKSRNFLKFIYDKLLIACPHDRKGDVYLAAEKVKSSIEYHTEKLVILKSKVDINTFTMTLLGACGATGRGVKSLDTLKLAMVFNQTGISKEQLNKCNHDGLMEIFYNALELGKVDFARVLLSNGIDLKTLKLTAVRLKTLYQKKIAEEHSVMAAVFFGITNGDKDFQLTAIDTVMTRLLKEDYCVCYGSKQCVQNYYGNPQNELQQLIIWSVLSNSSEFAYLFWKLDEENALPNCLIIARLFDALKKMAHLYEEAKTKDIEKNQRFFESLCLELLTLYYKNDPYKTLDLISQPIPLWAHQSIIDIAANMKFKPFIAHPCVQKYLEAEWWGKIRKGKTRDGDEDIHTFSEKLDRLRSRNRILGPRKYDKVDGIASRSKFERVYDDYYRDKINNGCRKRCSRHLFHFITFFSVVPAGKLRAYVVMYTIFLVLFSYHVLMPIRRQQDAVQWIVFVMVVSLALDELRQVCEVKKSSRAMKIYQWGKSIWNVLDGISIIMYFVGFIALRSGNRMWGRGILAADLVIWLMKVMQIYRVSPVLGPYVVMIYHMVRHLVAFVFVLLLAVIGYGIFMHTLLFPDANESWHVLLRVFFRPYLFLFGELGVGSELKSNSTVFDTSKVNDGTEVTVIIALAFYLLFSNVMLLNLLIATFNNIFDSLKQNTDEIWKFERYDMIMEFKTKPFLVFPLSIPENVYRLLRLYCCKKTQKPRSGDDVYDNYSGFQRHCMRNYWKEKEEEATECIEEQIKELKSSIQAMHVTSRDLIWSVDEQLGLMMKLVKDSIRGETVRAAKSRKTSRVRYRRNRTKPESPDDVESE